MESEKGASMGFFSGLEDDEDDETQREWLWSENPAIDTALKTVAIIGIIAALVFLLFS